MRSRNLVFLCSILVTTATLSASNAYAETSRTGVEESWVMHYAEPESGNDLRALAVDSQGNVCVTGRSFVYDTGGFDYATIKYSPNGTEEWVASYNGLTNGTDEGEAITTDMQDNVYVTGDAQNVGYGYTTEKYASDGTQIWTNIYGYDTSPGLENHPTDMMVDEAGNVYVTGWGVDASIESHFATVKIDAQGELVWAMRYGEGNGVDDEASAVTIDESGNVYVTGKSGLDEYSYDCVTIKYALDGTELWVATYNGPENGGDATYDVAVDGSGNVYVTGASDDGTQEYDYVTIKYAPDGTELWVARYDDPHVGDGVAADLELDAEGNVYVTGEAGVTCVTIKYDNQGTEQWIARYVDQTDAYDWSRGVELALDEVGNVYVTADCVPAAGTGVRRVAGTSMYTNDGALQWEIEYGGPTEEWSFWVEDMALDDSANVFVGGTSSPVGGGAFQYSTIKYVQIPSSADEQPHPDCFILEHTYPNPAGDKTILPYVLPTPGPVTIRLFNARGQEVCILEEGFGDAGRQTATVDTGCLGSGVYVCRVTHGGVTLSKKLVVMNGVTSE